MKSIIAVAALALAVASPVAVAQHPHHHRAANTTCHLRFTLSGWSAIYKTSHGRGTVTCDNGQRLRVALESHGGGLTVGRSRISGRGRFSPVPDINDVLGAYAAGGAHAGMVGAAGAGVLTNGRTSLALHGAGSGVDLGVDLSGFTIRPLR